MNSSGVFISIMAILLVFNMFYFLYFPNSTWNLTIGAITGFIFTILGTGLLTGVQVLGSGLNTETTKIVFGCGTLLNVLFQINVAGFPIGFGLITNILNVFGSEFLGLGVIMVSILGVIAFISGIMMIIGSS